MKDIVLLCPLAVIIIIGLFVIKKVCSFLEENQKSIFKKNEEEKERTVNKVWIAAETPVLFHSIATAMESCCKSYMEFFICCDRIPYLIHRLQDGSSDIILLEEDTAKEWKDQYSYFRVPFQSGKIMVESIGLTLTDCGHEEWVYVLWNQKFQSPARDQIISALQHENAILQCAYCDYIE